MGMCDTEFDACIFKFQQLWYAGIDALLDLECIAGNACFQIVPVGPWRRRPGKICGCEQREKQPGSFLCTFARCQTILTCDV